MRRQLAFSLFVAFVPFAVHSPSLRGDSPVNYTRDIKPILLNRCLECHNADDRRGQFETTSVAKLLQHGKKAGAGVVPGEPDASAIVQYIRGRKESQMPKGNPPLPEEELHLIRSWIAVP